ncbi:MAG: hypothetical protein JKY61_09030 [Planctomycetes bacterium]|nr:hypothetical protein [Planctomycetota bacterium]
MKEKKSKSHRFVRVILVLGLLGAIGFGVFAVMLRNWTVIRGLDEAQAGVRIQKILAGLQDARPYFEVDEAGRLVAHLDLESDDAKPVASLNLVVWQPSKNRWVRTDFPMWFVRAKTHNGILIGPLRAVLAEDWGELSLEVSNAKVHRRGPGLVMHLIHANGRQILLWNEPPAPD